MASRLVAVLTVLAMLFGGSALADTVAYRQRTDGDGAVRALWFDGRVLSIFTWGDVYYTWDGALTEHAFLGAPPEGVTVQEIAPGDGGVFVLLAEYEDSDCVGARLCAVAFDGEGNASLGEGVALEWGEMTDEWSGDLLCRDGYYPMVAGGEYVFVAKDRAFVGSLAVFDLATGEGEFYDSDESGYQLDVLNVCAYGKGTALIGCAADRGAAVYEIDLATGKTRERCLLPGADPHTLLAFDYDAETDALTYAMDGSLYRMTGFDPGTAALLSESAPSNPLADGPSAQLSGGRFAMADWETVRIVDPGAPAAEINLKIANSYIQAIDDGYYAFLNAHPDAGIAITNPDFERGAVANAILTQSSEYDIYVLSMNRPDYLALRDRGYLYALSDSDALGAYVGAMYPAIREIVEVDGAPVAVPVDFTLTMLGVNMDVYAAIGLTEADVPRTWAEFFQLLNRLPELLADTDYMAFMPTRRPESLRMYLFDSMLHAYQVYLQNDGSAGMRFDTEEFRAALAAFERVDFEAIWTDENLNGGEYDILKQLFDLDAIAAPTVHFRKLPTPLPLAFAKGVEPFSDAELTVAVVNPYSENPGAAVAFLEAVAACVAPEKIAAMTPGMDGGILWPEHEERIAQHEERIAQAETGLQNAKSDADREKWREKLDAYKENYEEYLADPWLVTPEDIAGYRAYAEQMRVWRFFGFSEWDEVGGEFYAQVAKYLEGTIDADALVKTLDEKVNMMLREGAR